MSLSEEETKYIENLQKLAEAKDTENASLRKGMATMFNKEQDANLVKWQLDIGEELERIEHLLRKQVPKYDEDGNKYFEDPKEEDQLFNNEGVNEVLGILTNYINKNIILSNFDEDEVKVRVKQFSRTFSNFIFLNYQKFGMNTPDKIKHYPMVVIAIVDLVESAYHRALNGGERTSLRTARTVHQTESPMGGYGFPGAPMQTQNKFSLLRPTTWFRN